MFRWVSCAVIALAALVEPKPLRAQDRPQTIDQIFAAYSRTETPGCSLGVIRDGRFIERKSYGQASLELGVPLSPESLFYVGSVSKQFTAASVALAAEQGLLKLDDNVRKYIPELPDYGHTITLREMLNQTSGLRDFFDLIYFSGRSAADFNSPSQILKLIEQQKELNNTPGAEWVYSNTNYFLLGIVLERATGKTLAQYAAQKIFRPLGMTHTRFYDDASVVVPGRVAGYDPGPDGGFTVDWSTTYAVVGAGGLMTTVDDLLQWDENFYSNRLDTGRLVKELQMPGILNDGNKTTYGMGLILGDYRGLPIVEHNGALFGYRADLLRFPEQRFTVVCLCNVSNASPEEKAREVADLYLKSEMRSDSISISAVDKDLPDPARFAGQYLDHSTQTIYSFTAANGHLRAWGADLRRKNANQFYDLFGDLFTFKESTANGQANSMTVLLDMNGEKYFAGEKLSELHLDDADLEAFAGEYKSPELDSTVQLSVEHSNLILKSGANSPLTPVPIAKDEFEAGGSFVIDFHRDGQRQISGLSWSEHAARRVEFARTH